MNRKRHIKLSASDIVYLECVYKNSDNHRERQRANSLLLSSSGKDIAYLSNLFGVKRDTISSWFNRWESGRASVVESAQAESVRINLQDAARSGRPSILCETEKKKVVEAFGDGVVNLTHWLSTNLSELFSGTKQLSKSTLRRILHNAEYSWRRVRKSMKKEQDAVLLDFFQQEITALLECEKRNEICLWFYDESGFNLNPNSMYAWLPKEKTGIKAAELPAKRGNVLTVAGFLRHNNELEAFHHKGTMNEQTFCAYVDAFIAMPERDLTKQNIIIIDNASFHKTKLVQEKMSIWKKSNVFFQFIPPYCSELNHIEMLWRNIKHQWLNIHDFASPKTLTDAVINILELFSSKYSITFG